MCAIIVHYAFCMLHMIIAIRVIMVLT